MILSEGIMLPILSNIEQLRKAIRDPSKGLPEEVFLFVSELTPLVNVDLLVRNEEGDILLAWRNDSWYGSGWHVPGGIIRVKETFEERIEKCAKQELHSMVWFDEQPLEIRPIIEKGFCERAHFITFVYSCRVPEDYIIDNGDKREYDTGYLAWHSQFPDKMLRCHDFYRKYFSA